MTDQDPLDFDALYETSHLLFREIINSGVSQPVYIDDLKTEKQCDAFKATLPLCYVWNFRTEGAKSMYSVSLSTTKIGDLIVNYTDGVKPGYTIIRDKISANLNDSIVASFHRTVAETLAHPRDICDIASGIRGKLLGNRLLRSQTIKYAKVGKETPLSYQYELDEIPTKQPPFNVSA